MVLKNGFLIELNCGSSQRVSDFTGLTVVSTVLYVKASICFWFVCKVLKCVQKRKWRVALHVQSSIMLVYVHFFPLFSLLSSTLSSIFIYLINLLSSTFLLVSYIVLNRLMLVSFPTMIDDGRSQSDGQRSDHVPDSQRTVTITLVHFLKKFF